MLRAEGAGGKLPDYPKESSLKGVGPRCGGAFCACRPLIGGDQEEPTPPAAGKKRFEIRIPVTVHPVWVNVPEGGVAWPNPLSPQQASVPSLRRPQL